MPVIDSKKYAWYPSHVSAGIEQQNVRIPLDYKF
ncbi:hypothetical protein BofuT4_P035200.1 [Botrytis cinerea T4]|uniref:Uncharacterized protein n=1 Tax=Botryotinia fuckeliana (strain T4) TaxID=999810 RepID=G2Y6H5_BOTF4|nr:hypothetical protein BofuT4_P035200.1 [Botrytis cinerea T4]